MKARQFQLVIVVLGVVLAHLAVLGILARVKTRRPQGAYPAVSVSPVPADRVRYADTRLRMAESPAGADLPSLPAPPVNLPVSFLPMYSRVTAAGASLSDKGQTPETAPAFVALARQKPPGFEAAAGPQKGILKGREALARHLQQVSRMGLDVVFVFDTTESMAGVIKEVKEKIKLIMRVLAELVPGFRVGMVAYRDYAAEYTTKPLPLTKDFQEVYSYIEDIKVGMGYKTPAELGKTDIAWSEAVCAALEQAIGFQWRPAARKVVILVGDAPPHPEEIEQTLAAVRSFWKRGGGVVHTIFTPPEIHVAKPAADLLDPKVRKLFSREELEFLMRRDESRRPRAEDETGQKIEEIYRNIALNGGGECVRLSDEKEIVREMLNSALGRQWRGDINEVYSVLKARESK